jgi:hypothetical protein
MNMSLERLPPADYAKPIFRLNDAERFAVYRLRKWIKNMDAFTD